MSKATNMVWVIFISLIIVLIGCTNQAQTQNKEPIKIGVVSPLTGSASGYGEPAVKTVRLAAEEINNSGGVKGRLLELIIEDGMCDAKVTTNITNKLISADGVKIILGGHCSTESLTIAPLANRNHVIQLASITSSVDYTSAGDYSFRNWPSNDYYVSKLAEIAYKNYGSRKVAVIYEQKEFPVSVYESFKKRFENLGGMIINQQSFLAEEIDLKIYLSKIKSLNNIDSIFFASQADDKAIVYFKTLKELGMLGQYKLFANNSPVSKKVFNETGGLNVNVITTDVFVNPEQPKTKVLLEAYKQKYGEYPQTNNFYVACSYDALMIIKDAIEACGSEKNVECIKYFLYSLKDWEGTAGKISFDKNGDAITTIGLHYFDNNGNEVWEEIE